MDNSILIGSATGWIIGTSLMALINGVVIYIVSTLNLGLKVKNFLWAMAAGVGIGVMSSTLWQFTDSIVHLGNSGLLQAIAHAVVTALAILFIAKFSKDTLKVNGFKGAFIAAISIGIIFFIFNLILSPLVSKPQNINTKKMQETTTSTAQQTNDLKKKLLTNITLKVPGTSETINLSSEQRKWSQGHVLIGEKVASLPNGAMAGILNVNAGGNASDVYLAVFEPGENSWQMTDTKMLGGNASNADVKELYTDMETVYVTYYTLPDDFESQADKKTKKNKDMFTYLNGKLTNLSGNDDEAMKDLVDLAGTGWEWMKTEMNDDSTSAPKRGEFVLSFKDDGSFQSTSDCNVINGSYGYNGATGQLYFEKIFSTKKYCPDSLEDNYISGLESTERVMFEDSQLLFQLKLDGGTMYFVKN